MKRILSAIILLFLAVSVAACGAGASPGVRATPARQPVQVTQTKNLVNGMITVGARSYYDIYFYVESGMHGARVAGRFSASGGGGNDILTAVMDDQAFINWKNGHDVTVLYSSGQITIADLNVPVSTGKGYHLVFDNQFSLLTSKKVSTEVNLTWSETQYR